MKHISKKMWRSVAAIAMVCCMLFSMATSVFAAETETNTIKLADIKAVIAEIAQQIEANGVEATAQNAYDYAQANGIIDQAALVAEALKVSVEENGVEATVKGVYDYAEANGYIAQIESLLVELEAEWEIVKNSPEFQAAVAEFKVKLAEAAAEIEVIADAMIAELEASKAELEAELAALKAEIDALKAELEAAVEEVKAEIEAAIAEIEAFIAEIEAAIAEVEAFIAEVKAAIEAFNAAVEATIAKIEAVIAEIEAAVNAAIDAVNAAIAEIEAALAEIDATATEIIDIVVWVIEMMYESATNGYAFLDEYTTVLSLGDSLAVSDDTDAFGKKLADELSAMVGSDLEYAELAIDGLRVEDLRAILDETYEGDAYTAALIDDIAAARDEAYQAIMTAGVITLSIGHDNFTAFAMEQILGSLNGTAYEMDWARYVTADGVAYVDAALAEVNAALVEQGVPADTAELLTFVVESYAYGYAGFFFNYNAVVEKIYEINPFATLILIGNYNAMDGMTANLDGVVVPVGDLVDCFVELVDLQVLATAMFNYATFVEIPATETVFDADVAAGEYENVTFEMFMANAALTGCGTMSASENGQEYIKDQILNTVTFEVWEEPPVDDWYELGDVNMDGSVNIQDAVMMYYHVNGKTQLTEEQIWYGDVAEPYDNIGNIQDAVLIYYFVNGKIDSVTG